LVCEILGFKVLWRLAFSFPTVHIVALSHFFAVVWNPWDKKAKAMPDFGDEEYKSMLCVGAAAIEKSVTLKPGEEWTGKQEISAVPSSYSSGQLDPELIRRMHTI
jgi:glucose-6-phosphate 1-epimerase